MVDLDLYRDVHKKNLIFLIERDGTDKMEFNLSFYAATVGCKILACYFFMAEAYGYGTFVNDSQEVTVLDRIQGLIRSYREDVISGVDPENFPESLNSLVKIEFKKKVD